MGCNCKKKVKQIEKFSDDYNPSEKETKPKLWWLQNIINYLISIIVVIFAIGLFIIIAPIMLIYLLICVILRKNPKISIKKFTKKKK